MASSADLGLKVICARLELNMSIKREKRKLQPKRWELRPVIRGENQELFLSLIEEFPDSTLVELSAPFWEKEGIEMGESGLSRMC